MWHQFIITLAVFQELSCLPVGSYKYQELTTGQKFAPSNPIHFFLWQLHRKKSTENIFPFIRTLSQMRICVPIQSHHQQIKIETQFVAGLFTVSLQLLWRFPLPILVFVSFFQCILTIWRLYSHNNHSVCQDCVLEQLVLSAFWFFWFIHCIFFSFTPVQVISLFAVIQMCYRSMLLYFCPKLLS